MLTLIGDSHGQFRRLAEIIKRHRFHNDVVSVGDVGIGFGEKQQDFPENFFFIHGNHDNPDICAERYPANYLGRFKYAPRSKIFFLSGAWSIDRQWRTEGIDWWPTEELTMTECNAALELYDRVKPRYVVTHDGPSCAIQTLVNPACNEGNIIPTRTGQLLDGMLSLHKPALWIFGHHHISLDTVIDGTRFVCLAELEEKTFDLDVS